MLTKRIIPDVNFNTSTATNPEVTFGYPIKEFPGKRLHQQCVEREAGH
jgi:hypothetical protein